MTREGGGEGEGHETRESQGASTHSSHLASHTSQLWSSALLWFFPSGKAHGQPKAPPPPHMGSCAPSFSFFWRNSGEHKGQRVRGRRGGPSAETTASSSPISSGRKEKQVETHSSASSDLAVAVSTTRPFPLTRYTRQTGAAKGECERRAASQSAPAIASALPKGHFFSLPYPHSP